MKQIDIDLEDPVRLSEQDFLVWRVVRNMLHVFSIILFVRGTTVYLYCAVLGWVLYLVEELSLLEVLDDEEPEE